MDPKPGIKTTEFWLTFAAVVLNMLPTILYALQSTPLGDPAQFPVVAQLITGVIAALAAIGYTVSRAIVKVKGPK